MGAIYTTILHDVRNELGITNNEYVLLDTIQKLSSRDGLCKAGTDYLAGCVGITRRSVQRSLIRLIQDGLLHQPKGYFKVSDKWSLATAANDKMSPVSDKRSPKSEQMSPVTDAIYKDNKKDNKPSDSDFGADLLELNKALGRTGKLVINQTRLSHLKARLRHFTVAELMEAATAIRQNDFMKKGGHNTIDYLLRNDEKVEQWLGRTSDKTESPF